MFKRGGRGFLASGRGDDMYSPIFVKAFQSQVISDDVLEDLKIVRKTETRLRVHVAVRGGEKSTVSSARAVIDAARGRDALRQRHTLCQRCTDSNAMPTRQIGKSARHAQPSDARSTSRMPDPNVTARIYTESGGWALPTIDADGLAAIALLRFCNINFSLSTGASRSMTTANLLPVVIFENPDSVEPSVCAGLPSLIALLTANITLPDPNHHLTPFMIAESTAFATLVTSRFAPARLYELYLNDSNYQLIYHTLLETTSSFPLNRLLPFLNRRQVRRHLADRRPDSLYFDADIALAALSTRLGDRNRFFYGDEPSVLDAIVFGYLATVLYVPLPCTELRAQVAKFSNLVAFVARVQQQFFARDGDRLVGQLDNEQLLEECRRSAARRAREQQEKETEMSEEETTRQRWNRYFVIASAAAFAAHVLLANEIEIEYE